MRSVEHK